jgi:TRAP-type mannitol/chloroaromatic compound transport system substrate-binding protein
MSEKLSRRSFVKNSLAATAVAGLTLGPFKNAHSQAVIKWRGQTTLPANTAPFGPFRQGETGIFAGAKQWTDWLFKRTNGRLKITWSEPGSIFPNFEADKSVAQGVVDICYAYASFYTGRIPEGDIEVGGLFFWDDCSQGYECLFKYGLYKELQNTYAKHNIFWVPFPTDALTGVGTLFPSPNVASMKGKKIRTLGLWGDYVRLLGSAPAQIPTGDVYMACKLGTVDGWMGGIGLLEDLKLKEVTKGFVINPRPNHAAMSMIINKDSFRKLPKDIQDILQNEAPHYAYVCANQWHNQCLWVMGHARDKYGLQIYSWPQEEVKKLTKDVVDKIFPKLAGRSSDSAKMIDIIKKQMKDYGRL